MDDVEAGLKFIAEGGVGRARIDLEERVFLALLMGRKREFASLREVRPAEVDYFDRLWSLARAAVASRKEPK